MPEKPPSPLPAPRPWLPNAPDEGSHNEKESSEKGQATEALIFPSSQSSQTSVASTGHAVPEEETEPGLASRVLSRITSRTSITPGPAPDGGFRAWMCVLGTHLVVMNTWGVINSFGVFQSYYVEALQRPPSDIAWIGSIEVFFLFFIGTFTGRLTDAGFFLPISILGSILVVAGTLVTSACTQYWQVFLAQGVCVGLGNGCLFCPAIAIISTYFQKYRSIAIGLTACGSVTGGLVFPGIVRELLPRLGFSWTLRVIGLMQAGCFVISLLSLKPRIPPRKSGRLVEWSAFKELEYTYYALGAFMCFWGVYFAFFFIAAYARDIQGMTYSKSLDVIMVMSGVGILGRLVPNYFGDRIGALTVFVPTAGLGALLVWCWIAVNSQAGLYVWAAVSGPALGGIQAMFPSALASLTMDPSKQGTRIGMVFTIVSFAVLTGTPIAGTLISAMNGRYIGAQAFAGACLTLGTGFLAVSREVKKRKQGDTAQVKV
ncbi:major facilitator superfamily domain-containing protein, partial [Fusarium solani]